MNIGVEEQIVSLHPAEWSVVLDALDLVPYHIRGDHLEIQTLKILKASIGEQLRSQVVKV